MAGPTITAVITAHDRREFLPDAVRSALVSGADEVVVVRNFRGEITGCEGRYRDVPCDVADTGEKEARGLEAATGDVVAFLDDDDLWEVAKVGVLRERFGRRADLVYLNHTQRAIDASGAFVSASHPEIQGKDVTRFASVDRADFPTIVEHVWPGNNSSTALRRAWALGWVPTLRAAGWACDLLWFVGALLDGVGMELIADPLVRLRLHDRNMSQTRGASPEEFRGRHGTASARFARAYNVLARVTLERRGTGSSMGKYLGEEGVAFGFFSDLENGVRPRAAAWRLLGHGPGRRRPRVVAVGIAAVLSPPAARRLLYRSSLHRWKLVERGPPCS